MIGAYRETENFAYPGWRLTVPGGPAGGHYKGYTHSYSAGTAMAPQDDYEATRDSGMAAHDTVHMHPNAPRGVYRSPAEVPPRANASGQAMTYRGMQTERHAGTSIAPGSFPAEFYETDEDAFIRGDVPRLEGLDALMTPYADGGIPFRSLPPVRYVGPPMPGPAQTFPVQNYPIVRPLPVRPLPPIIIRGPITSGATNVVPQPPPQPPAPVLVVSGKGDVPVSPAPAPVVDTHQLVPIPDGSGNYVDSSDGTIVPPSQVSVDATGKVTYRPGAQPSAFSFGGLMNWLGQNTIWSALPNGVVLGGGVLLAAMAFRGRRR
jgi:hypothetical protein